MRFADADVLPYDFRNLATTIAGYSTELKALVKQMQNDARTRQRNIDAGYYKLAADPEKSLKLPEAIAESSGYGLRAVRRCDCKAERVGGAVEGCGGCGGRLSGEKAEKINAQLALAERKFLNPAGLPKRPWVEHVLYAPGWYTGYGVKTVPGVREAIEDGRFDEAKQQLVIVTDAVNAEAEYSSGVAKELKGQ